MKKNQDRLQIVTQIAVCAASFQMILIGGVKTQVLAETVQIKVVDDGDGQKLLPCRIHLSDAQGKPQRAGKLPFWRDHFVCPGTVKLKLTPGKYTIEIERGPEYERHAGTLTVEDSDNLEATVRLKRIANLAGKGWWSGDLHVHRKVEDIELLMRAEDLHVAPVITWWNNRNLWAGRALQANSLIKLGRNRYYDVMAGEDEREGGALLYFHLKQPLKITGSTREYPSPMKFVANARRHDGVWIDIEKPFWWDVPIWLAGGQIDSIGLANNHMCRSRMYESEAWGRPRDSKRLPSPRGNGFWTQEIYYHILNCGLRVPPSAGSASGVLPNPVGYNRVYVHLGRDLDYKNWWKGLKAGRSFVTNGPLLLVRANGHLPGHVFASDDGKNVSASIEISLTTNDSVQAVQIIKNGQIARTVPLGESRRKSDLDAITFKESGWFLIRAIADNKRTFRFASTAPYYVEIGKTKHRISKRSAQFFLDWVEERMGRVKLKDSDQRREVLKYHIQARKFWQEKVAQANAR